MNGPNAVQRTLKCRFGVLLMLVSLPLLCLSPLFYLFLTFVPCLLLFKVTRRWYRRLNQWIFSLWLVLTAYLSELLFGIRHRVFGYKGKFDPRCIMIMNHRCHLDWFFLWSVMARKGSLDHLKVIMKKPIKKIPILGWLCQLAMHIFLCRYWQKDQNELSNKLHFYNILDLNVQLLIFPEGTTLYEDSKMKSDAYAKKNGLPIYKYALHPRTKGLTYSISILKEQGLNSIYDITVAYPDSVPYTEYDFYHGIIPTEVFFYIDHFAIEDLPQTENGLAKWCQERWQIKENRLAYFYKHGYFNVEIGSTIVKSDACVSAVECQDSFQYFGYNGLLMALAVFSLFVIIGAVIAMYVYLPILLIGLPGFVFFGYFGHFADGLDNLELRFYSEELRS